MGSNEAEHDADDKAQSWAVEEVVKRDIGDGLLKSAQTITE